MSSPAKICDPRAFPSGLGALLYSRMWSHAGLHHRNVLKQTAAHDINRFKWRSLAPLCVKVWMCPKMWQSEDPSGSFSICGCCLQGHRYLSCAVTLWNAMNYPKKEEWRTWPPQKEAPLAANTHRSRGPSCFWKSGQNSVSRRFWGFFFISHLHVKHFS